MLTAGVCYIATYPEDLQADCHTVLPGVPFRRGSAFGQNGSQGRIARPREERRDTEFIWLPEGEAGERKRD